MISFLLAPSSTSPFGHEGQLIASHIRNLKDLTTLNLTPNPSLASINPGAAGGGEDHNNLGTTESHPASLFVCPLSLREMNGSVRFVHRKPGGTVMSESSLKEMRRMDKDADTTVDPVTGAKDAEGAPAEEWVTLNPKGEELEQMKVAWEARKLQDKEDKKALKASKGGEKKRKPKADATADGDSSAPERKRKMTLKEATSTPVGGDLPSIHSGSSIPKLSATLAAALAESKKTQSAAVQSLYAPKDRDMNHGECLSFRRSAVLLYSHSRVHPHAADKDGRSTWMTRGAFTRFA